jgi:hypothetical protein
MPAQTSTIADILAVSHPVPACRLSKELGRLAAENEHLKEDNDRLCRVIDSGDWGRQRVQELLQAGRVLQEERDALARLVGGLQQGGGGGGSSGSIGAAAVLHDATNSPTVAGPGLLQQYCVSPAGIHPSGGGGLIAAAPCSRPASPGAASAAAQNKMLVRNGSSFNALVRALKQDLVTSGALRRSPAAVYEVDKVGGWYGWVGGWVGMKTLGAACHTAAWQGAWLRGACQGLPPLQHS